jgi:hypothetical protein
MHPHDKLPNGKLWWQVAPSTYHINVIFQLSCLGGTTAPKDNRITSITPYSQLPNVEKNIIFFR